MVRFCTYCSSSGSNVPFYRRTTNNVLFTAVGRQMSGFEPSLPCFCLFFSFFLGWVSAITGAWVMYCLQQQQDSSWVGLSPLFPLFVCCFRLLSVLFFGWVRGVNYCCCSYSSTFHSIPKIHLFSAFQVTKCVAYFFIGRFSKPENSQKNRGYLRPTLSTLYQVTSRNSSVTVGPALQ